MSDAFHPFDDSELSPEDLAVIRAFDEMKWETAQPDSTLPDSSLNSEQLVEVQDAFLQEMMLLFVDEVSEDLAAMQNISRQLETAESLLPTHFLPLRRGGHKIRGSAGTVDCRVMARIAGYIEDTAEQAMQKQLVPEYARQAIASALAALEDTLESIVNTGCEDNAPLARLTLPLLADEPSLASAVTRPLPELAGLFSPAHRSELALENLLRVDPVRVEQLSAHSQQLMELRSSVDNAQDLFAQALQELHLAQTRLRRLQPMLSMLSSPTSPTFALEEHASSSLVARILEQRSDNPPIRSKLRTRKSRPRGMGDQALWDELDIERYSEQDLLLRSLSEAIADVSLTSMRVQTLSTQYNLALQRYTNQVALVHEDVVQLRLVPLRVLLPEIRAFIQHFSTYTFPLEFDIQGENVEADQAVLDVLRLPLLQLLQTCLADKSISASTLTQPARAWFHAEQARHEVTLEIGFSMPVSGGALDCIREPLQLLNGSVLLGINATDGMSFYLRFPRTYGAVHCLLVRVAGERFMIPVSQVQRVSDCKRETLHTCYQLASLLGLPSHTRADARIQPVLILPSANSRILLGITVDEVLDEMELVVKPLPSYLQRPGITSAAIDGQGRVLLLLHLPELIHAGNAQRQNTNAEAGFSEQHLQLQRPVTPKILIADDSVSMRQSLRQMLSSAHYTILEARDGIVALEQLLEHLPHILLLDLEMPNLNGYDVLRSMRSYPQLAHVKTIILTSRSSEKHVEQARTLGADLYMTKPVALDVLLSTVKDLLSFS